MIATRAADCQVTVAYVNLVGANDGLVFDGGGYVAQNGRVLLDAPRFREGVQRGDGRPRSHAPPAHREHDLARGPGGLRRSAAPERDARARRRAHRVSGASALAFPAPANRSFFLPVGRRRSALAARLFCEELLDALALGVGDYFEKNGCFKTIGVALSGGRDSLLVLAIARRWIDRRWAALPPEASAGRRRASCSARSSCRRATRRPRRAPPPSRRRATSTRRFAVVSIDDAFERELVGGREDAPARRVADAAGAPERAGARPRGAHVDVGERRGGALPPDEQHEREGRRLRDDRRRRRGGAQRHRERAEDGRELPPRLALRDDAAGRASASRC